MSGFTITIAGVEQATAEIRAAVRAGVINGMEKLGILGENLVVEGTPIASGNLAKSEHSQLTVNPTQVLLTIDAGPPADVYAAPVETGTRPHFPPVDALLLWVKQKFDVADEKQARSIAFCIARKISKRGTKGAHMFANAEAKLVEIAPGVLEAAVAEAIAAAGLA